MNRAQAEGMERRRRKVFKIESNNRFRVPFDRRRKDMTIIRVGKIQRWNVALIAGDETVGNREVHQVSGPFELFKVQVRSALKEVCDPLIMDVLCPSRAKQAGDRQLEKEIPHRGGIQNTGIEENDGTERIQYPIPRS